jgi:hypothetical protein
MLFLLENEQDDFKNNEKNVEMLCVGECFFGGK